MDTSRGGLLIALALLATASSARAGEAGGASAKGSPPGVPAEFRIVATDTGFEAPDRVPAGIRHVVFENRGANIHEGMLVKLPDAMTAQQFVASVRAGSLFPDGALDYSGVGLSSPGEHTELWTRLDPGNYIVICWNGNHATHTAVHPFRVIAEGAHDDPPPKPDVVLRLIDYRFELSRPLRIGTQVMLVETVGPSMHEADLYRLLDGKTVADLNRWRKADGAGTPPAVALGGMLDSHDLKHRVWLRRDFGPGRYVLHCEMPMSDSVKAGTRFATHADAGMVQEFEIRE